MTIKHAKYTLAGPASDPRVPSVSITIDDAKRGEFTAIVSAFGNVDYQGDVVVPGAFKASLEKLRANGDVIPVVWSHDWNDPFAHVGFAWPANCREVGPGEFPQAPEGGLLVKGRFDIEKPFAKQVYDLVRERRVTEWSFAYDTVKEKRRSDGANELLVLDLLECGPTLKGANAMTSTIDVKATRTTRDQRAREAARVTNLVAYRVKDAVPGLLDEVKRAAKAVVDDEHADITDVREAVTRVVERRVTLAKYARADAAISAKWATYATKRALVDLIADLEVSSKGTGRHQSVNENDEGQLREHLRQRHGNDVTTVQVDRMSHDEMRTVHRVAHGGGVPGKQRDPELAKAVDELIADVRREKAQQDADRFAFEQANLALLGGGRPAGFSMLEPERDRERAERERVEMEKRWELRRLEADRKAASEAIAAAEAMQNGNSFATWTDTPIEHVAERLHDRVEPRIIDAPRDDDGETFSVPTVDDDTRRVNIAPEVEPIAPVDDEPSEPVRVQIGHVADEVPTRADGEGTTYRLPISSANDPDATIIKEET